MLVNFDILVELSKRNGYEFIDEYVVSHTNTCESIDELDEFHPIIPDIINQVLNTLV